MLARASGGSTDVLLRIAELKSYNGDAVVVDVCLGVKLLLDLGVLGLGPGRVMLVVEQHSTKCGRTYSTPLG